MDRETHIGRAELTIPEWIDLVAVDLRILADKLGPTPKERAAVVKLEKVHEDMLRLRDFLQNDQGPAEARP